MSPLYLIKKPNTVFRYIAILSLCSSPAQALQFGNYDATIHNRFINFQGTPTHNTSFLFNNTDFPGYDLTSVGWDGRNAPRSFTMISPIHYLRANHFSLSGNLTFITDDGNNTLITRNLLSGGVISNSLGEPSDLYLGKISTALNGSEGISFSPYHNGTYIGSDIIVLGSDGTASTGPRAGTGNIVAELEINPSGANTSQAVAWLFTSTPSDNDTHVETGDSGSPVFIDNNGTLAIIGVNLAVGTISDETASFATLVPHYVNELNAEMALDGYHLTKAIPGSSTLELTRTIPTNTIRAGHEFTITLDVENKAVGPPPAQTIADNVKLENTFPTGTTVTNATGTGWFDESTTSLTRSRRAFIDIGEIVSYSMTVNIPTAGTSVQDITYYSDQSSSVTESFNIDVIESFISWSAGLTDTSTTGDDDLDGINNLLEYAFGGDPTISSHTLTNSITNILPVYDENTLTYIRRTDASARALTYTVTTSTTLEDDWVDASSFFTEDTPVTINSELESVTLNITPSGTQRFYRIEVTLAE